MNASAFAVRIIPISLLQHRRFVTKSSLLRYVRKSTRKSGFICASAGEPPKTKSSFYKNPSKAIEKGGGFYFPGLRGPRLRLFVTVVGVSLLTINHLASLRSPATIPSSFTISEFGALLALLCLFSSAYLDITKANEVESGNQVTDIDPQVLSLQSSDTSIKKTVSNLEYNERDISSSNIEQVFAWVAQVAIRMTEVESVYIFRDGSLEFSSGSISNTKECGQVVARVARENKSLYIDDSSRLPPNIDVPFLDPGISRWSLFLVPIASGKFVTVFSAPLDSESKPKLSSAREREWLKQCTRRIQVEI